MGTGTSLRVDTPPSTAKLADIDEEKVSNIVEVCNVSREEALRVLDACHMDETMAIERFLSGNEVSTWSQVSKKKKPTSQARSGSARNSYSHSRNQDRDRERDRDRDRRDRDRSSQNNQNSQDAAAPYNGYRRGPRHHGQHAQSGYPQKPRDYSNPVKKRAPVAQQPPVPSQPVEKPTGESSALPIPEPIAQTWGSASAPQEETWGEQRKANGDSWLDAHTTKAESWPDAPKPAPVPEATENMWSEPSPAVKSNVWGAKDHISENATSKPDIKPRDKEPTPMTPATVPEVSVKPAAVPTSTVKRTFNYAAAAAAGTSHAKPAPITTDMSASVPISAGASSVPTDAEPIVTDTLEDTTPPDAGDAKKRRARPPRKTRTRVEPERPPHEANGEGERISSPNGLAAPENFETRTTGITKKTTEVPVDPPAPPTNPWTRQTSAEQVEEKRLKDTATSVAVATTAVVGTEQSAGDSLSLQFGSFGLSGLDSVNWSASEKVQETAPPASAAASEPLAVPSAPLVTPPAATPPTSAPTAVAAAAAASTSTPVGIPKAPIPSSAALEASNPLPSTATGRGSSSVTSAPLPPASVGASGSGMFPILPMGPGGNFAPPNYGGHYLMPPLPGYSPALGSYDSAGDLSSSRGPNLAPPGSLPMYEPGALANMASGNNKFSGIPGLGDMSGLPPVPSGMGKDGLHGNGDIEKNNTLGSSGLPTGMDPLATPYMMPGYPSMQYPPMYTFPNAGYHPPGMAPPGPNPFPYPPTGQVSSQGARGGFGFEDGSAGLATNTRTGAGLGESMYTPGGYLNTSMTHSGSQKGPNEAPYKQVRGSSHPGNGLGGMGMASGIVHGMTYGDYSGNVPGVSNGPGTSGPGSWNSRQANGGRSDGANGPGVVSQSMAGGTQNSALYAAGPGGVHGGYWNPQQGGYYP